MLSSRKWRLVTATAALALAGATFAGVTVSGAVLIGSGGGPAARRAVGQLKTTKMCGTAKTAPTYKHVIVIVFENNSYTSIVGQSAAPYINSVIGACGLATDYHNITHPSLPEYIAMTDGMTLSQLHPFLPDCSPVPGCDVAKTQNNIFHQSLQKGGWKAYDESMPSNCFMSDSGNYAPRHNPAVYYLDLSSSCSKRDVPLGTPSSSALLKNFSSQSTAPSYAFVTPNLIDDMHNGTVQDGDNWLKTWLPRITATPVYRSGNTAIFITWDEGEPGATGKNCVNSTAGDCHVATIVVAPSVKAGTKCATDFSHYSLLKTTEQLLGLPQLGQAKTAKSMLLGFNL